MLPREISELAGPLLDRLVAEAQRDPRYVGVALGGSAVTGTMDVHSDLDVVLVGRDGAGPELVSGLPALAARLGPLAASFTGDHVGEPRLLIALYGPPALHVDLKAVTVADLGERVEDAVVVWERDDGLSSAYAHSAAQWPAPDPQWIEDRFWVWVHYGAARVARGELLECVDLLAMLRTLALGPLIAVAAGTRPQGARRLERLAPERVPALAQTLGGSDRRACVDALAAAAALYDELRAVDVERRDAARQLALDAVAAVDVTRPMR